MASPTRWSASIGTSMGVKLIFPDKFMLGESIAQQTVFFVAIQQAVRLRCDRMPVLFSLPGVVGQINRPCLAGEIEIPVDRNTTCHRPLNGFKYFMRTVIIPQSGIDDAALLRGVVQAVTQVMLQDCVGTYFYKDTGAILQHLCNGLGKQNRLTQVVPPVVSMKGGTFTEAAGNRGIERNNS